MSDVTPDTPQNDSVHNSRVLLIVAAVVAIVLGLVLAFYIGRATAPSAAEGKQQISGLQPVETDTEDTPENDLNQRERALAGNLVPNRDYAPSNDNVADAVKALWRGKADDPRALGPMDAPVRIIEFSDYSCPMCTKFQLETMPMVKELAQAGKVRLEWHEMPIFADRYGSSQAAAGGIAAGNQGKFWEFVQAAYASAGSGHPEYTPQKVIDLATQAGVPDLEKFKADLPAAEQTAYQEFMNAHTYGIQGTPAFFIGHAYISGAMPTDFFRNTILIQSELK